MFTLRNEELTVEILDPVDDQDRFGTRYCTGGYIFQIVDKQHGALMSGPTYPDDFNWFDGQGIPDAFSRNSLEDPSEPGTAIVPGIGLCDLEAKKVLGFCIWDVQATDDAITMTTQHLIGDHRMDLERTVTLRSRTIRSTTFVQNAGKTHLPISWFPHPFYPQLDDSDELCRFSAPVSFPDNDGFEWADSGFIARKDWPWSKGHYQALDHSIQGRLTIQQKHPKLGLVGATCSYVPGMFPIWGNTNTFSWEPYFERTLARGQSASWWIDYQF